MPHTNVKTGYGETGYGRGGHMGILHTSSLLFPANPKRFMKLEKQKHYISFIHVI